MSGDLYIDFETYSEANLIKVGPWAYSRHPSTRVLFMAWAFGDDAPQIWTPGGELFEFPHWVKKLNNPHFTIHAQNDFFELCIMKNVLKWPIPGPEHWHDISAESSALGLPRSLENCGVALGHRLEHLKDNDGKRLIRKFSTPAGSSKKLSYDLFGSSPDWSKFKEYCIKDVIAARANKKAMRPLDNKEREIWELDRKINLRGVRIDLDNVKNALEIKQKELKIALKSVHKLTNGQLLNINSRGQFLSYCRRNGVALENGQKGYLANVLNTDIPGHIKDVIRLRLSISKSSLAKYDKLLGIVDPETNLAHGLLRYHGAFTGRWSGNLFQPQNLPRPSFDDTDACISLFKHKDPEVIRMLYGDVFEALSSCIRGMVIPRDGNRFVVSDFSQIESRVLAWLAGDEDKLRAYRDGLDIYKTNAVKAFKVKYENVTKYQRTIGKVIELACGYQGGVGAFSQFANLYGLQLPEEEINKLITTWREGNKNVVDFWKDVETAAIKAIHSPGKPFSAKNIVFKVMGKGRLTWLYCRLPSGRLIAYHCPTLKRTHKNFNIHFWGVNSLSNKYDELETYGGKLVENITQAVARDIMADRMPVLEAEGYPIVLTVHDEIITDTPEGRGSLKELNSIMKVTPDWAKELPVEADGYEGARYRK